MNFNNPFNTVVVNQETNPEGTGGTRVEDIAEIDTYYGEPQNLTANEYGVLWIDDFMFYDKNDKEFHGGRIAKHVPIVAGEGVEFEYDAGTNVVKINAAGGTTLNKYTVTTKSPKLMVAIHKNAKGHVVVTDQYDYMGCQLAVANAKLIVTSIHMTSSGYIRLSTLKAGVSATSLSGASIKKCDIDVTTGTIKEQTGWNADFEVVYYNDTEITV